MKRLLFLIPALALAACADAPETAEVVIDTETASWSAEVVLVGEALPAGDALTADALVAQAEDLNGETVLVEGEIEKVCQMAGCWLTFLTEDNQSVRVAVPRDEDDNYMFTFPTNASGRMARVAGTFTMEEESVETLRHYAEDEGASEEEVAAITEPRLTLALEASGAELTGEPDPTEPEVTDNA
ncbi:MAG: DUF4920 domain-containing protein [Bacteroidota bacterium]